MPDELHLDRWKTLSIENQKKAALKVASVLPNEFRFVGIQSFAMGDQACPVAVFDYADSAFSLIPGATVTLGYDPGHPFQPTQAQLESWQETVKAFGLDFSIHDYLLQTTTPLRTVHFKPFLLETRSNSHNNKTHQQLIDTVNSAGFRLPTSDEWEYACSASSRTLFHWGDDCPSDHYHTSPSAWDQHKQPNAFGLHIAADPYRIEAVLEPEIVYRGGDGGGTICGGAGFLAGWLTLASAYMDKNAAYWHGKPIPSLHARRLFTL